MQPAAKTALATITIQSPDLIPAQPKSTEANKNRAQPI